MYRSLDPVRVVDTAEALRRRVTIRFPESGLSRVSAELATVAAEAAALSRWLARPQWLLRLLAGLGIVLLLLVVSTAAITVYNTLQAHFVPSSLYELLQGADAAINETVLLGVAIFFLLRMETRIKRTRAQKAIHVLRSIAHIIDMHQLTKDPHRIPPAQPTSGSGPKPPLSPVELERYLDYCSELLSVCSKIAAIYVQHFDDEVTLAAVNDVEELTSGLSRKIWQKIMILDRVLGPGADRSVP